MKKFKYIVTMLIALISSTTKAQNEGGYFRFKNPNYLITKQDVVNIAQNIDTLKHGVAYRTSSGQEFIPYFPKTWKSIMQRILTKAKGSTVTDIAYELNQGEIVPWDDNISVNTTNYGIAMNGKIITYKNYKGGNGVRCLLYNGYPVLKTAKPCLNPNDPNIEPVKLAQQKVVEVPENKVIVIIRPEPQQQQQTFNYQAPAQNYPQAKHMDFVYESTESVKPGFSLGVNASYLDKCISSVLCGNYSEAVSAGAASFNFSKTQGVEKKTTYSGNSSGMNSNFPNMSGGGSSSATNGGNVASKQVNWGGSNLMPTSN